MQIIRNKKCRWCSFCCFRLLQCPNLMWLVVLTFADFMSFFFLPHWLCYSSSSNQLSSCNSKHKVLESKCMNYHFVVCFYFILKEQKKLFPGILLILFIRFSSSSIAFGWLVFKVVSFSCSNSHWTNNHIENDMKMKKK